MTWFIKLFSLMAYASIAIASSSESCTGSFPLSCHNTTAVDNTCCFITSGSLLQTQFWDTRPPAGPSDSWTIHGLWPDNCNGSYPQNCDPDRQYANITQILKEFGAYDILSYMEKYWKSDQGKDEEFWQHEWDKHGTCISTLEPRCYSNYEPTEEVVAFFGKVVELFKALPTYDWLANAGITPSYDQRYYLDDVQSVLEQNHGHPVTLNCKGDRLQEVWYYFNVQGSLQSGSFVPAYPIGEKGECPQEIWYPPKRDEWRSASHLKLSDTDTVEEKEEL